MLGSLGVEICFVFPALEWGSDAEEKEEQGNSGASSWTDLRKASTPLPQYDDVTGETRVWEFTIRVLGLIKHRCTQTPTQ